ncbi:MAG: ATP-binding cassette domain-containing protein [Candidatus Latescibacteria bacterium]|nr:ATP-binding cassette domain-containing protein [Candidatus Latescibacterota bacterium]
MQSQTWQTALCLLKNYPRVFRLVWDTNPLYFILALTLSVVAALLVPLQIWLTKLIIDGLAQLSQSPIEPVDWYAVLSPVGALAAAWILGLVCQNWANQIKSSLNLEVRQYTEYLILQKTTQLDIAFFESSPFYDQMDTVLREAYRATVLSWRSFDLIASLAGLGALLALLAHLHPLAVVLLIGTSFPQAILGGYFANRFYRHNTDRAQARRKALYLMELLSSREAVKEIRLFGLDKPFLQRFQQFWRQYYAGEREIRFAHQWISLVLALLSLLGTAAIWAYAIVAAVLQRITLGDVTLVLQASEQARGRLGGLFSEAGELYETSLFTTNLFDFLDLPADAVEGALQLPAKTRPPIPVARPIRTGLEFCDVSFGYPGSDHLVLEHFSAHLPAGQTTALVGTNGSGKTTLAKLVARFYDPTHGHIKLDGHDLRDYELASLRDQLGIIFQDFLRFDLSAGENIGLGHIDRANDDNRITEAARLGGAQGLIEDLPQQYNQMLGKRFDGGIDLSGGQWQKFALSRAFMRDAQILVLDEPTAALDALAEYEMYRRFAELTTAKTTLFISHRFSTVRSAQHILVLDQGRLQEQGTHAELMARQGAYAQMFALQAERYR